MNFVCRSLIAAQIAFFSQRWAALLGCALNEVSAALAAAIGALLDRQRQRSPASIASIDRQHRSPASIASITRQHHTPACGRVVHLTANS
jgi:hypothetical protein